MMRFNSFIKWSAVFVLIVIQLSSAVFPQTANNLKEKIAGNSFPANLLSDYEFHLLNSNANFDSELEFLNSLTTSFETRYLKSVIYFRQNNFTDAYFELNKLAEKLPEYYPFYYFFTKTSNITGNEIKIDSVGDKNIYKIFLEAQIAYQNADYLISIKKLTELLKSDSTSFEPLYLMAYCYRNIGDYENSLQYFNIISKQLDQGSKLNAKIRVAMGSLFYLSGDYQKAKKLYKSGLNIAGQTNFNTEKIKALLNLGMILDEEGSIDSARANFNSAIDLAREIADNELEAICLSEYAVSLTYTGEKVEARKKYEASFLLFKKLMNKNRYAFTAVNIGSSYLNIANYKSSAKYYQLALQEAGDDSRIKILALRGLGDVSTNLSDYSKALDYYQRAKKIAQTIKDLPADAEINIGLGVLYFNLKMFNDALRVLLEADGDLIENDNPYLKLEVEQKIGIVYSEIDSLEKAKDFLQRSNNLANKFGDVYSELRSNTFLADVEIKLGNITNAKMLLGNSIAQSKQIGYNQLLGIQNVFMSELAGRESDYSEQLKFLKLASSFAETAHDFNTLINTNYNVGLIYEREANFYLAEKYYLKALKLIEQTSDQNYENADIQIKYFANYYDVYDSLVKLYLNSGENEKAFIILEKSRARNTYQNLVNLRLDKLIGDKNLLIQYYDLRWKLNSGIYEDSQLEKFQAKLEEVKKSMLKSFPDVKTILNSGNDFNTKEIQDKLKDNQYIFSYYVQKEDLYAFILSSKNLVTKKINVSSKKLNQLIKSISPYYNSLSDSEEIQFNNDLFSFNAESAYYFYDQVVSPIIKNIPINSELIFSLPSELLLIPFELLVTENDENSSPYNYEGKNFLIDKFSIMYTPSSIIWSRLESSEKSNFDTSLLIGNPIFENAGNTISHTAGIVNAGKNVFRNERYLPLEYSEQEIDEIGSLLTGEEIFLAESATETSFKNNAPKSSIIHLSTHSILKKNKPMILFSTKDNLNDGYLEVGEIIGLNLNSDLVVLSSCKSGLGKIDKAEGIRGMQKAFFDAGAKSVVVSLWDVDDKFTSILMREFYYFLAGGNSKTEALRLAKLKFIKEINPNPYYWAAFTISGNNSPLKINVSNHFAYILIPIFILMVIGFYVSRKSFKKFYFEKV